MLRRSLQTVALCAVTVVMLGAGGSRFDRLGHQLVCMCGCTQGLLECNHVGCPVSPVMIGELRTQLAAGAGDTPILNWFAAKYGAIVLASPSRGGFDNVAWIAPMAVFFLATIGTGVIVWLWKRRGGRGGPVLAGVPSIAEDGGLRERIRRETEYR